MTPHVAALCYAARVVIERAEWYSPALRRMEQALDAVEREPDPVWEALVDVTLAGTVYMGQHDAQGRHLAEMRMRDALTVAVKLVGGDGAAGPEAHTDAPSGAIPPTAAPSAPTDLRNPTRMSSHSPTVAASNAVGAESGGGSGHVNAHAAGVTAGETAPSQAESAPATLPVHEPATSPGADANAGEPACKCCGRGHADGHAERVIPCDPDALKRESERA